MLMGNFVTDKMDGEIVEAIDFMVERVCISVNVFSLSFIILKNHYMNIMHLFAVGKFDATGVSVSINDELCQLLRTTAKSVSLTYHHYRCF